MNYEVMRSASIAMRAMRAPSSPAAGRPRMGRGGTGDLDLAEGEEPEATALGTDWLAD